MTKAQLLDNLASVERKASISKFRRMLVNPFKYAVAILHRKFVYKSEKNDKEVITQVFFEKKMHILLPTSTDIYLTGGKSHDSEIRLAKYLIDNLTEGDTLIDVGAHYGYFTLLGATLVGDLGKVYSYEASPKTYHVLSKNTRDVSNITSHNLAVSDTTQELTFYEFPNFYSEYNTFNIGQFKDEDWYQTYPPSEVKIKCVKLDLEFKSKKINPKIIKIDVEGAEYQVIKGMEQHLRTHSPHIIMEYLSTDRGNSGHHQAENLLKSLGYSGSIIKEDGSLVSIESAALYLKNNQIDSDNIVFMKS